MTLRQATRTASVRLHGLLTQLVAEPVESPTRARPRTREARS